MKILLLRLWPRISRRLASRAQQLELNLWTRRQAAESSPGSNSRYGVECVNPDRSGTGDTFDAMEMQRVQVYYAFYEARFIGCGWQMPPDAKVRRLAITFSVFYRRGGETRFRRLSNN